MSLGERIKKVRKALDLTQQEFGGKIGSTQNAIGNYETGHRNPSRSVINNICKTFNISEVWLRSEDGEMFVTPPTNSLDALAKEYNLDEFGRTVIEKMLNLNEQQWEVLQSLVTGIVSALSDPLPSSATVMKPATEMSEEDIQLAADSVKKGLYEEKEQAEKLSASPGENGKGKEMG